MASIEHRFIFCLFWVVLSLCLTANAQWLHNVTISMKGNDTSECLRNQDVPCRTLYYVLKAIKDQNCTALFIEPGHYNLNSSFSFWHVKHVAIIGSSLNLQAVVVNCSRLAGLSFIYSEEIVLENITFASCGALQNSTSRGHPQFLTGLFLVNCIGLKMDGVKVIDGPGIGLQLYDVTGTVKIFNCHFHRNGNNTVVNAFNDPPEYITSGGGIYIEYTFEGGLWPFNTMPNHIYQENGNFLLYNSSFKHNVSPPPANGSVFLPNASNHVAFGRGGGLSIFFKGNARNNEFCFKTCQFQENYAGWGAGFFIEFQDKTQNNSIKFSHTDFSQNRAEFGGGGSRIGLITRSQSSKIIPNVLMYKYCYFKKNKAILGGAVSLYGTTKSAYSVFRSRSFLNFTSCTFKENSATIGSVVASASWSLSDFGMRGGSSIKVSFLDCSITENMIIFTEDDKVTGTGGLYSQGIPILLNSVNLTSNNGSALVLDSALVHISGKVVFQKNTGSNGGGIALYGESGLCLAVQSQLKFIENSCDQKGGAIYVRSPGPLLVGLKTTALNTHPCFVSYDEEEDFNPDNWDVSVEFEGNRSPNNASGHSVFATTLQYCRRPGENRINNTALEWNTFHYNANGRKSDMVHEIVTEAVEMVVNKTEWNVTDDKNFSPTLKLFDEKYNSVYGIISINFNAKSQVVLEPPSAYYLVKDRIQFLVIQGKPGTNYSVNLSTVNSQLVFKEIDKAYVEECSPGFVSENKICKCDVTAIGVSRCEDKDQILLLLKGYWGTVVECETKSKFITAPCPMNYCICNKKTHTSFHATEGECYFDISNQCKGFREGRLCGKCKANFSLKIGEDNCVNGCGSGFIWVGHLIGLVLLLTLLVLVIMFINFDPFSAYLNAWLYSYQVILHLLPEGITLDPFLLFVVGLANVQIIGFGGLCMWSGMDDLQKLAFNYLLPLYIFICLFLLNKIALTCDNCITRRLTQKSTARALCTLFVLSYSSVTYVSLNILYPVKIGEKYFVFRQGTEEYFGSYHTRFAIPAVFLLVFVGILFPLVLIRRQWFNFIDRGLTKLLLDNFQNCFRNGYKWCSGYYFLCRFIILLFSVFIPSGAGARVTLLQSACIVTLTVFVLCRPYGGVSYNWLNNSDTVLLCNLCIVSTFSGALSGTLATGWFYFGFKIIVQVLGYVPLAYSVGLFGYYVRKRVHTKYQIF